MPTVIDRLCPDCLAKPGNLHTEGCDIEQCPKCGRQLLSCNCLVYRTKIEGRNRLPWTGVWPGVVECQKFGWYAKFDNGFGYSRCDKDDPDATEDLNRIYEEAVWNEKLHQFEIPEAERGQNGKV